MRKQILVVLSILVAVFALATKIFADENCTTSQYGTTTCAPIDVSINKFVKNPVTGNFVNNLLAGDAAYSPGSDVTYRVTVTNDSAQDFDNVLVTDVIPGKLTRAWVISTDKTKEESFSGSTLTFKLKETLKAHTGIDIDVGSKVADSGSFSNDKNLFCGDADGLQNTAKAKANDRPEVQDSASICVQTNVLGKTTLPTAGPEDFLPLIPFAGMGLTGIALLFKKRG